MLCIMQEKGRGRMKSFTAFKQMTDVHISTSLPAS